MDPDLWRHPHLRRGAGAGTAADHLGASGRGPADVRWLDAAERGYADAPTDRHAHAEPDGAAAERHADAKTDHPDPQPDLTHADPDLTHADTDLTHANTRSHRHPDSGAHGLGRVARCGARAHPQRVAKRRKLVASRGDRADHGSVHLGERVGVHRRKLTHPAPGDSGCHPSQGYGSVKGSRMGYLSGKCGEAGYG